ncbi:E3 ubiquitin-protein ligase [Sesbania bispinosa]|nr:E3 ubiquitin-protein ligase [Sesbania bispinosa]
MGNLFGRNKKRDTQISRNDKGSGGRISSTVSNRPVISSNFPTQAPPPSQPPSIPAPPRVQSLSKTKRSIFGAHSSEQSSGVVMNTKQSAKKYALIPDNFTTLEQVHMFLLYMY